AARRFGEERQVRIVGERHFRAGDRLEVERLRALGEGHRAVHTVAVGEGEGAVAEAVGGGGQVLGEGGAVEEREGRVAVELCVGGQETNAAVRRSERTIRRSRDLRTAPLVHRLRVSPRNTDAK